MSRVFGENKRSERKICVADPVQLGLSSPAPMQAFIGFGNNDIVRHNKVSFHDSICMTVAD